MNQGLDDCGHAATEQVGPLCPRSVVPLSFTLAFALATLFAYSYTPTRRIYLAKQIRRGYLSRVAIFSLLVRHRLFIVLLAYARRRARSGRSPASGPTTNPLPPLLTPHFIHHIPSPPLSYAPDATPRHVSPRYPPSVPLPRSFPHEKHHHPLGAPVVVDAPASVPPPR